jgi:hypothetical protein
LDQSLFAIHDSPLYFETSEDDHPRTVSHARDYWWTLDFADAFLFPRVNSWAELVPFPRAYAYFITTSRRMKVVEASYLLKVL